MSVNARNPTLNIWITRQKLKVMCGKDEIIIGKGELLFLVEIESGFYIFKTEKGKKIKISGKAQDEKKIEKAF